MNGSTKQVWDLYWSSKKTKGAKLYDVIAEIYRKFLIRPCLNYFTQKHFAPKSKLMHAGCGSGQVDRDIYPLFDITGFDISPNALEIYARENASNAKTLLGSIFEIPVAESSFDGIYNLGVMEHFDAADIHKILVEFRRVLKPGGKIVLLWPPEFGLSVMFFKFLTFVFTHILRKPDVKFHPDEICRAQSRCHGEAFLMEAGFTPVEYYFGPRDFFTYSVFVGQKS
jgi:SAM-dependent methyltransferase